jgi:hypothetical protein
MKTLKNLAFFFAIVVGFVSCMVQYPKFTSVENLFSLNEGMIFSDVVRVLGSKPYDIYMRQQDGYSILIYKYKLVERKVNSWLINERGAETTGIDIYNNRMKTVFIVMNSEGKLESFITDDGRDDAESLIMVNNTIHVISTNRDNFLFLPLKEQVGVDNKKYIFVPITQPMEKQAPVVEKNRKKFLP